MDTLKGPPLNSLPLCVTTWGKSKEISQNLRKNCLQAEEHHPNCETWGWQHPLVRVLSAGEASALYKIDGMMKKNDVEVLKPHHQPGS